jgi:uncharacterized protein
MPIESAKIAMNVVISGTTGLIGSALCQLLKEKGFHVRKLVRHRPQSDSRHEIYWNPSSNFIETAALENTDILINLSGKNIADRRWTTTCKKAILESRIQSTKLISRALARLKKPPRLLINASALGFYGDRGDETIDEKSKPGVSFLSNVCRQWETATAEAERAGISVIYLRSGIVLDSRGGILKKISPWYKAGLAGVLGSGNQYMSWICISDVVLAIEHIIYSSNLRGPVNLVSPNPVTNKTFCHTLAKLLHRHCSLNISPVAIRFLFGQLGEELFLHGCKATPNKLLEDGYVFQHAYLEEALRFLLASDK